MRGEEMRIKDIYDDSEISKFENNTLLTNEMLEKRSGRFTLNRLNLLAKVKVTVTIFFIYYFGRNQNGC